MNKDSLAFKGFIESRYQITLENDEFLNRYLPVFKHELESWQAALKYERSNTVKELSDLIQFEYGDCNCDSEKKCSYCKIIEKIKEIPIE
jgi:hypothetical protein